MAEYVYQRFQAIALSLHHVSFFGSLEEAPEGNDGKDGIEYHQCAVASENADQLGGESGSDGKHQRAYGRAFCQDAVADIVVEGHGRKNGHLRHCVCGHDHAVDHIPCAGPYAFTHGARLDKGRIREEEPHVHHEDDGREDKPGTVLAPTGIGGFADHAHQRIVDRIPDVADEQDHGELGGRDAYRFLRVQ